LVAEPSVGLMADTVSTPAGVDRLLTLHRCRSPWDRTSLRVDSGLRVSKARLCCACLQQAYSLDANSYVQKPVDFEQFIDSVRQLGLYWLLLNRRQPSPAQD
jgi:hypothetical protein